LNLPIGGASGLVIFLTFSTPKEAAPLKAALKEKLLQMDPLGTLTIMAAVICYVLALQWAGVTKAWNDSSVIGTFIGFSLITILFIAIQWYNGERAIIVGRLLKNRTISIGMIFIFFFGGAFFVLLYYLPIYFQVIDNVSASDSGIRNLAMIIAISLSTVASGSLISAFGHFVPLMILGGVLSTVGAGLIYTLDIGSPSSQWIGYQVLSGLGIGIALQIPIIAAQATSAPADISSATAMLLFAQTLGGAIFVTAAQSAFTNTLVSHIAIYSPSVMPGKLLSIGATELRSTFSPEEMVGILKAYMEGLRVAYGIAIAAAGIATCFAAGNKWRNLKGANAVGAV
jgi:hypothetical protein